METFAFKFAPGAVNRNIPAEGKMFVYESGVSGNALDLRVYVKPDNGAEMILRPGQGFETPKKATMWAVRPYDPASTIDGFFNIGNGKFFDANTLNTFKLDGTFTNTVKVNNTLEERVPVSADVTQTIPVSVAATLPVSIVGTVTVAGSTVQYTNSWVDISAAGVVAQQIFSAAANPNGAYIEFAEMSLVANSNASQCVCQLLAKATAPASATDGDCVMVGMAGNNTGSTNGAGPVNLMLGVRIKIPAGKGLWLAQSGQTFGAAVKTVLYTLL